MIIKDDDINKLIQTNFVGTNIYVTLYNGVEFQGEVVFNFEEVISLKDNNNIMFINKDIVSTFF